MWKLFGQRDARRPSPDPWDLSRPLLAWSRSEMWTIRDACEGTLILGATGSGKTSSSGQRLALTMLGNGNFGGLVLTAKPGERELWESYCRAAGRSADLIVFSPTELLRFNFLDYERRRSGRGAGLTENVTNLFTIVLEIAERKSGNGAGRENEAYWQRALKQLLRNLIDLLMLANGKLSIPELYRIVVSAPTSIEQARSEEWKKQSLCYECLQRADQGAKSRSQQCDFDLVADYFLQEFPSWSDRLRSSVVSTFTSLADSLNRGVLRELFCRDTNVTPDVIGDGKILLIDLPVKEFSEVGQVAQGIWKYCFQRAIERRDVAANPRPVFLWCDEAQHFVTSYDQQFQTTARSSRVATVMLSQSVATFHAALGHADAGRAEADSLFGNLCTKIFHANGDTSTNEWASSLIGRTRQLFVNGNTSRQNDWTAVNLGFEEPPQVSAGFTESYEFEVQPSVFTRLRTGGPANRNEVDAIVVRNGKVFNDTGRTWRSVTFKQR